MPSFLTLNNLFPDDKTIDEVIQYKQTNQLPDTINSATKRRRFLEKFQQFQVENGKLFYNKENLHLQVIKKTEISDILNETYDNLKTGLGGIVVFYKYICSKYINIKRKEVAEFLKSKPLYQIVRKDRHRVNKPILAYNNNSIWSIDLIDLNYFLQHNRRYRYILTVVDVFSRHLWLEKLKKKEAEEYTQAMIRITNRAGVRPDSFLSDNGLENLGEFKQWCKENGIKQRFIRSHTPQANLVESTNKIVRSKLNQIFARTNSLTWIDNLKDVEDWRNSSYIRSIKGSPNQIWTPEKIRPEQLAEIPNLSKDDYSPPAVLSRHLTQIKQKIAKFQQTEFNEGDLVRVRMSALFAGVRQVIKSGDRKQIVIEYCPQKFRIYHKIIPRQQTLERARYLLEDVNGRHLIYKTGTKYTPVTFYASDLQDANKSDESPLSIVEALKLNKVDRNLNDVKLDDR
jgi:hypothetical protein